MNRQVRRAMEAQPRATGRQTVIFRRDGFSYPVEFLDPTRCGKSLEAQAAEHAELNPGTLTVEDMAGNVLWRPQ